MSNMIGAAQSLDVASLGTNLGIFLGFIVAAILGLKRGLKLIDKTEEKVSKSGSSLSLVENQTLLFWTESNRAVTEALVDLRPAVFALRDSMLTHAQLMSLHEKEMAELRHEIALLRSRLG